MKKSKYWNQYKRKFKNQWQDGDIITWNPIVHHCGSNAGMTPKITLNVTGLINSNSIHLGKKKKFIL